jgi:predicted nucleic acid-binding protein
MIVISDTGPLHYLVLIECLDILPALYGQILVPRVVVSTELADAATPESLKIVFRTPPSWLVTVEAPIAIHPLVAKLGIGEAHAISLALQWHADLLLCDDLAARKKAVQAGLSIKGTLALIHEAASRGLIDFDQAIIQLTQQTNFRYSPGLIEDVRRMHRLRPEQGDLS